MRVTLFLSLLFLTLTKCYGFIPKENFYYEISNAERAQNLFNDFVELEKGRSPSLVKLYSDSCIVIYVEKNNDKTEKRYEISGKILKLAIKEEIKENKSKEKEITYSAPKTEIYEDRILFTTQCEEKFPDSYKPLISTVRMSTGEDTDGEWKILGIKITLEPEDVNNLREMEKHHKKLEKRKTKE